MFEIDTAAVILEGVPEVPPFFFDCGGEHYERSQRVVDAHGEIREVKSHVFVTPRAYYHYRPERHALRIETSAKRSGESGCALGPPFYNPDWFEIEHVAARPYRVDEAVTMPVDLLRFASAYQGPPRSKRVEFAKTGVLFQSGRSRLRIYNKGVEAAKNGDGRYAGREGKWWRIEYSCYGSRHMARYGYVLPLVARAPAPLVQAVRHARLFQTGPIVTGKAGYKEFCRYALNRHPELLSGYRQMIGEQKNARRVLELLSKLIRSGEGGAKNDPPIEGPERVEA